MNAYLLDDGTLLVPMRAEGPDGIVGDGMVPIGKDHPDYPAWLKEARPLPVREQPQKPPVPVEKCRPVTFWV